MNKFLIALSVVMFSAIFAHAQNKPKEVDLAKYYRRYVLQKSLYLAYEKDNVFGTDVSFSIINDLADYPTLNSHGRMLDSLATAMVKTIEPVPIPDYEGKKSIFFDCIVYFESEELKKEVLRILRSPKLPKKN